MIDRNFISHRYIRGSGIEIGAYHNPFPVNAQMKVTYVDRYPYEQLAKMRDNDPNIRGKSISRVDVVDDGMYLKLFENNTQDFVLSSHHLEHCFSPLDTIENHLRVLKPGGVIFYAVPDKRFTFDKDRRLSDIERILSVYWSDSESEFHLKSQYEEYLQYVDKYDEKRAYDISQSTAEIFALDIHWFCWNAVTLLQMISNPPFNHNFDIELFSRAGHENFVVLRKV